ncbi:MULTISPECIES: NYN domain-containing protein [unclassified Cryobacterium]|uniref:NYN domain-containing protein n=1 Tax=unclassified Cryobacterium TaxID=2649013 RepID=UPI00106BC404|nr:MULTISPECIES: NYN domain-containing protein [unclassified Cryobacterium]MDY7528843.1 NYN domain-containing protein [Cryobacterium sp. 10C2]MDY7555417.1 NYN domain-containing protein [Cryobacterium sp. 10C3]MEB0003253.1 NYN domain-containing protein [Cryobacterium sp. RTC2.1]MEB0201038.1 NYN domain-containing protein [Cryobacterium sp. 5I3]MEB0288418.1 NYN domain-containing protein [Cryobacterium sp. 10S3]
MAELSETRVAVYIDFDNIIISQYDNVHGRGAFIKEKARTATGKTADRLQEATVNIGAVLDFASSFGAVAISRAYADWAAPANTRYQKQLVDRAVDLVQLFNTSGTKNGADIRLAIDVVEDLFRLQDISHVVIVAGDSDYIPLAQSARRLGRTVIGIGVQGSTSAAFKNACDEFSYYHDLVEDLGEDLGEDLVEDIPHSTPTVAVEPPAPDLAKEARKLLMRALRGRANDDVDGWMAASALKQQMKRLDPGFDEKKIGFKSFTDFLKAQRSIAELQEDGQARRARLRNRA